MSPALKTDSLPLNHQESPGGSRMKENWHHPCKQTGNKGEGESLEGRRPDWGHFSFRNKMIWQKKFDLIKVEDKVTLKLKTAIRNLNVELTQLICNVGQGRKGKATSFQILINSGNIEWRPRVKDPWTRKQAQLSLSFYLSQLFKKKLVLIWTIFKVFIEFATALLLFYVWGFGCKACGSLDPWPGIETSPPALKVMS